MRQRRSDANLRALPDPGERGLPRYSRRELPAYRYVTGLQPHPTRDPCGHSYASPQRRSDAVDGNWSDHPDWRFGIDLFNRFYFWEAHEAWEGLWANAPRDSAERLLFQGLIQLCAALLKIHAGVLGAAQKLAAAALAKLRRVADETPQLLQIDVGATHAAFTDYMRPLLDDRLPPIDGSVPALRFP